MAEQSGEKSEDATQHRRDQAREKGQIPKSQDLISAAMLIGALGTLNYFGEGLIGFLADFTRDELGTVPPLQMTMNQATHHAVLATWRLAVAMVPILLVIMTTGIAMNVGQTGFMFLPNKLTFDVQKVNPISGFGRLFSIANAVKFGFGIFKIIVVMAVAAICIWLDIEAILGLSSLGTLEVARYLLDSAFWISMKIGAALLILALLDFAFQRWKHEQDLKMTKEEVREEVKSMQGDPQIAARRRQVARQLAMNRMASDIPKADVVVTNPTELAIALKYDPFEMNAPVVLAKGAGLIAQRIRRLALENNIPVVERKELARALYQEANIGKPVPVDRYAAVAEVMRYIYELQGKPLPTMEQLQNRT
ncbi:MAG: flagellar biosynthesis protein FlhB [Pirellulaceae bacterium]